MSDSGFSDFFDYCKKSFKEGFETLPSQAVSSRPNFWKPFHSWRDEEKTQLRAFYESVKADFDASIFSSSDALEEATSVVLKEVIERTDIDPNHPLIGQMIDATLDLLKNDFFTFPEMSSESLDKMDLAQANSLRSELETKQALLADWRSIFEITLSHCTNLWIGLISRLNPAISRLGKGQDNSYTSTLISLLDKPHEFMTGILSHFMTNENIQSNNLFVSLNRQLYRNVLETSGVFVDPDKPLMSHDVAKPVLPNNCLKENPSLLIERYFKNTILQSLLSCETPIIIPQQTRFEHCHVLGGTGHGKTQCLQYLIHQDLCEALENKDTSVVVIDSQGSLINNLYSNELFAPDVEGSLADRLVLIDPADIDRPPALNLFNPGLKRLENYSPQQREIAFNSLVDIYGRFFGSLLGAELSGKQSAVFRYLARLMLTIEGATIHTLIELMDGIGPFKSHIEKLDPTAKRFFEKEFSRKAFNPTRNQIKDRLYAVLSIPTFDRLFSAPETKINFFDALNSGKIILIDTAKGLLKDEGTAIFGRFMLALIEHAVTERANMDMAKRNPVYLYMDEAHEYFDDTVESLLIEARKFKCGLTLAHQNLTQLSKSLCQIFIGNTSTKFVGGITDKDAKELASDMRTNAQFLLSMKKEEQRGVTNFALSIKNVLPEALKVSVPLGYLEGHPRLKANQITLLLERNREKVGYDPLASVELESEEKGKVAEEKKTKEEVPISPTGHSAAQRDLAALARERGFGVEVEYILENERRIDLAIFGHGLNVAVEVSVTNRKEYELTNIEKALEAEFDQVWMIAEDPKHREEIARLAKNKLSPTQISKVIFGSVDDLKNWLNRFEALKEEKMYVAGYEVKTVMVLSKNKREYDYRNAGLSGLDI